MKFNPKCVKPHPCEDCENRCIRDIAFLYGMPDENQMEILSHSTSRQLKRGDYLFHEGDEVRSIVIIREGQVKLSSYDAEGRENIIGIFSDEETIWEGVFAGNRRYPYSAICLTDVCCCYIRRSDIESAVSNPAVALQVIHMLSSKLHDANERNMILSVNEPVARIAAFLIYCGSRSAEPVIKLRLDDIAGSVGLRPETVSRYIRRLMKDGMIEKVGQSGIRITDFAAMRRLVNS